MTKPIRRILILGAVSLAVAIAGGSLLSPLSASPSVAPAKGSLCVAPDVAGGDVVASHDKCAWERRHERRMCRRHGFLSVQCLSAWIETAKCEGRYVDSQALTASMRAVRGTSHLRFLDEGTQGFRYAVAEATQRIPADRANGSSARP